MNPNLRIISEDAWAEVELFRWQYGELPRPDDMRPLDVSAGLRGMAAAIRKGDLKSFPSPMNVIAVLEYAARVIAANNELSGGLPSARKDVSHA